MSFLNSSSQQNRNNSLNVGETSANVGDEFTNKLDTPLDPDKFEKCPKSTSSVSFDPRYTNLCLEYDKCFSNTFEYSANNFDYGIDNSYGLNTISNQTYNSTNQIGYDLNYIGTPELPKQTGKWITSRIV